MAAALYALAFGPLTFLALALDPGPALAVSAQLFETLALQPLGKRLALWAHRRTHAAAG